MHKCTICDFKSKRKYNVQIHEKRWHKSDFNNDTSGYQPLTKSHQAQQPLQQQEHQVLQTQQQYHQEKVHQERPQSIYKIDNSIPSILGKQNEHKCEFCNYSSDRKHDVKRHAGKKHKQEYIQKLKLGEKVFKILEEQNMEQVRLKEAYKEAVNLYIKQRLSIDG